VQLDIFSGNKIAIKTDMVEIRRMTDSSLVRQ